MKGPFGPGLSACLFQVNDLMGFERNFGMRFVKTGIGMILIT